MSRALRTILRRISAEEGGWAMAITMVLVSLMVGLGLATFAYVDGQSRGSARERLNESGFNLAEGALTAQMYILTRNWPTSTASQYPAVCPSATQPQMCPDATALRQSYNTNDYGGTPAWTTEVHDNGQGDSPDFYNDSAPDPDRYDENGDGKVWVRAQATVHGRTRVILGLVQIEQITEELPRSVLVAGSLTTDNNGNKAIICTRLPDALRDNPNGNANDCTPASGLTGPVQLRCTGGIGSSCQNYRDGQIQPPEVQTGYTGTGLSPDAIDRLRQRAVADGTYYASGCPANPSGEVVFVENGNCSYTNSVPGACCNSATNPGIFLIYNGTLSMTGNHTFFGVIYAVNAQGAVGCSPACPVTLGGTVAIRGGVQVGGQGAISAGSSKLNVIFDDYAFSGVKTYGAASLVQNKWREITPRPGT